MYLPAISQRLFIINGYKHRGIGWLIFTQQRWMNTVGLHYNQLAILTF